MTNEELTQTIVGFLLDIGLRVRFGPARRGTFLPGIDVRHGGLIIDKRTLRYPADLLHEAGHLAVVGNDERLRLDGDVIVENPESIEVAAIAWSYAAAVHLGIDLSDLFHAGGYKGNSESLALSFRMGVYPGAPMLERLGLTKVARPGYQGPVYPQMLAWLAA